MPGGGEAGICSEQKGRINSCLSCFWHVWWVFFLLLFPLSPACLASVRSVQDREMVHLKEVGIILRVDGYFRMKYHIYREWNIILEFRFLLWDFT